MARKKKPAGLPKPTKEQIKDLLRTMTGYLPGRALVLVYCDPADGSDMAIVANAPDPEHNMSLVRQVLVKAIEGIDDPRGPSFVEPLQTRRDS